MFDVNVIDPGGQEVEFGEHGEGVDDICSGVDAADVDCGDGLGFYH